LAEEITVTPKGNAFLEQAPYFTEHVRRYLVDKYGEEAVLNGGLPKWLVEGRDLEDGPARTRDRHFLALQRHHLVRSLRQMIAIAENASEQVVDARSAARFSGAEAEPRAGLRKGAIPGSLNLPFPELLDMGAYGTLRPASELRAAFTAAGVDLKKPFTATCGSGITAAVIAFAAYLLGQKDVAVYDGSFAEWGAAEGAPVVVAA
ncbi:MAG: rhodanese-like domain-containing protein, partial [Rhodospirillales bacterium]